MSQEISLHTVHDKNLNFLIGSGASVGIAPTLALGIRDGEGIACTLESLATKFEKEGKGESRAALLMHYYRSCIEPILKFDAEFQTMMGSLDEYEEFLKSILKVLSRQPSGERRCNVFTTNYDPCITHAADNLQRNGSWQFLLNDGGRGIHRRYLHVRNYNSFLYQSGVFERDRVEVPQINLIQVHGSSFWFKEGETTYIDTANDNSQRVIINTGFDKLQGFSNTLQDESASLEDLPAIGLTQDEIDRFYESYNPLPIVNPTKWKFHETVFEELYYQLLRHLSYELEKPNAVLITFGFSFADEHILNIVKRSLVNPRLKVFVCCFNEFERTLMEQRFKGFANVEIVCREEEMTFAVFNEFVFNVDNAVKAEG